MRIFSVSERESLSRRSYQMRLAGKNDFEVAEELGITAAQARELGDSFAEAAPSPTDPEARREEIARIDVWLARVDASYLVKEIPIDKAVTAFCRLSERRSKLMGLDKAPSRSEIAAMLMSKPHASIDEEVAALANELGLNKPNQF